MPGRTRTLVTEPTVGTATTRREAAELLLAAGAGGTLAERMLRRTAPARHAGRVEQARDALLAAAGDTIAADRVGLVGALVAHLDAIGVGPTGRATDRHPALTSLGKGRKQASDGNAWSAAIDAAAEALPRIAVRPIAPGRESWLRLGQDVPAEAKAAAVAAARAQVRAALASEHAADRAVRLLNDGDSEMPAAKEDLTEASAARDAASQRLNAAESAPVDYPCGLAVVDLTRGGTARAVGLPWRHPALPMLWLRRLAEEAVAHLTGAPTYCFGPLPVIRGTVAEWSALWETAHRVVTAEVYGYVHSVYGGADPVTSWLRDHESDSAVRRFGDDAVIDGVLFRLTTWSSHDQGGPVVQVRADLAAAQTVWPEPTAWEQEDTGRRPGAGRPGPDGGVATDEPLAEWEVAVLTRSAQAHAAWAASE